MPGDAATTTTTKMATSNAIKFAAERKSVREGEQSQPERERERGERESGHTTISRVAQLNKNGKRT